MAVRDITIWPWEKVLDEPTRKVTEFGAALEPLLQDMADSVKEADGIGIAANQIGVSLSVALVGREDGTFFEICNPEILEAEEPVSLREGCLSVPNQFEQTPRFHKVKVRYQDKQGIWQELAAEGRLAHVLQHEIDHLYGKVFVSKLSQLKRGMMRERMKRYRP